MVNTQPLSASRMNTTNHQNNLSTKPGEVQYEHVLVRFHVIRWFSTGLTQLRSDVQRREPPGTNPVSTARCSKHASCCYDAETPLTQADRDRLDLRFAAHPRLKAGWRALQELHGLYQAEEHKSALAALDRFCDLYQTGELPEFHSIVDTIISWSEEILAWHHTARPSSGRIEGTNNLLQVLRPPPTASPTPPTTKPEHH